LMRKPPFAVAGAFEIPSEVRFLPIASDPRIENQKRYGIVATGHACSTPRFQKHNATDCARTLHAHDILSSHAGTTRNYNYAHAFGRDGKPTQQPYSESIQSELGATPGLHHKPSTTGLLGDANLAGFLPHRSSSYQYSMKLNPGSLDTADIPGAQPGEPNKFLVQTKRHINPIVPAYVLPSSPPRSPSHFKGSGRDSLSVKDINEEDARNQFGTGWNRERKVKIKMNLDRSAGLEGPGKRSVAVGIPDFHDVTGNSPGRKSSRFGRDDRCPLGKDLATFTRGVAGEGLYPGVTGSGFKSSRHTNPLKPVYCFSASKPTADFETLRGPVVNTSPAIQRYTPSMIDEAVTRTSTAPLSSQAGAGGGGGAHDTQRSLLGFQLRQHASSSSSPASYSSPPAPTCEPRSGSGGDGSGPGVTSQAAGVRCPPRLGGPYVAFRQRKGVISPISPPRDSVESDGSAGEDTGESAEHNKTLPSHTRLEKHTSRTTKRVCLSPRASICEYGHVAGSQPANPHLQKLRYKSSLGSQAAVTQDTCVVSKESTLLVTHDIEGAAVLPYGQLQAKTCFNATKVIVYWYKVANTDT
jgi:hypothetical protein